MCFKREHKKTNPDVTNVYLRILQTENDESVESFRLQESVWRWSFTRSLCSSCTSRRATSMPESFHSSPHMWRALIFNTINHGGGFGSWGRPLFTRLSIWLSVSARPLSCDYEFRWLNSETMLPGGHEPWPQSRTHLNFFSSYNNLRTLCKTIHSITPVREVWFRHTWAGSLVCWWPGKTPRWPTGCNRAGKSLNRENLRALRKPNYFPAKRLNPDCKRGMWTADIFPVSRFPLHLEMCKSLNSTVKYGSWRHMIFETPKDCKTVFALARRNFRVSI